MTDNEGRLEAYKTLKFPTGIARTAPDPANRAPLDKGIIHSTLHAQFERIAKRQPNSIAVHDGERAHTFQQIDLGANRVAAAIRDALANRSGAVEPPGQKAVALLFGFDAQTVIGMLGGLKAGMFFVALHPEDPPARNSYMLADSGAEILVTNDGFYPDAVKLAENSEKVQKPQIINIDRTEFARSDLPFGSDLSVPKNGFSNLVYTSGSTGKPKGVIDTHTNLLHNIWQISVNTGYGPGDRHGRLNSLVTGGAILYLFANLLCSASIYLYNVKLKGLSGLPKWLQEHEINSISTQPPLFRLLCNAFIERVKRGEKPFSGLRLVSVAGDKALPSDIELFKNCFPPGVILRHGGGSSEAGAIAECYLDHNSQIGDFGVPWGYPAYDKQILIWDDEGNPLPEGEIGEIVVKSRYVSPGYWRRPELNRQVFLPDPQGGEERLCRTGDLGCTLPGGLLFHKGRKDHVLKVRSNRVDPGEVENALLDLPYVKGAAVVGMTDSTGETQLAAFIMKSQGTSTTVGEVREILKGKLPDYMIPARIHLVDMIPLTPTGKVDRMVLSALALERPTLDEKYKAPRTKLEARLAAMWEEILDLEPVGISDGFLELGGNSLSAMRVVNRINELLPVQITLPDLLSARTIEELAGIIEEKFNHERL